MVPFLRRTEKSLRRPTQERRRKIVVFGVSVVGLAIVIAVVAAIGPWRSSDSVKLPNVRLTSNDLVTDANDAARSGDTTRAIQLARKAVSTDPTNEKARQLVSRLDQATSSNSSSSGGGSGGSGGGNNGGSSGGSPSPDAGFTEAISNLAPLLPTSFPGFALGSVQKSAGDLSMSGTPNSSGSVATRMIWAVHDRQTVSGARDFLTRTSRQLYGSDAVTIAVDGAQAYFGTDDVRFATVAYTRGRYAFEVLVTANGVPPKKLKSLAVSAALGFADRRP